MGDSEDDAPKVVLKEASPFMQTFWDLSSVDADARQRAAVALLTHVKDAQSQFEELARTAGAPAEAAPASGDPPSRLCSDLDYTWKRCVRRVVRSRGL